MLILNDVLYVYAFIYINIYILLINICNYYVCN